MSDTGDALTEARAEIARLREAIRRLADQDATLSVHGGAVTVTMDGTLTVEEREAIEFAIRKSTRLRDGGKTGATLRALLSRLGSSPNDYGRG